MVDNHMKGDIKFDKLVSFNMPLDIINEAFHLIYGDESIRSVVLY